EERAHPVPRPIDELVRHDDVSRRDLFAETADGAHGDHPLDAELLQREHVRAEVQLARQEPMPAPVPGQEDETRPAEAPDDDLVRGRPERRIDRETLDRLEPGKLVESAAAEDAEGRFRHTRWPRHYRGRCMV